MSLTLARKVRIFEPPARDGILPWSPLVGERFIALYADAGQLTLVDRATLAVVHRRTASPQPVGWIGSDRLVVTDTTSSPIMTGVWDCARDEYVWRLEGVRCDYVWRGSLITWPSNSRIELRSAATGEIERAIDLDTAAAGYSTFCGDHLIWQTPGSGDPIRAVYLPDGRTHWTRAIIAEIAVRRPDSRPVQGAGMTQASMSDRFILTWNGTTSACALADGAPIWTADVYVSYYWPLVERGLIPILTRKRFVVIDEATGALIHDRPYAELAQIFHQKPGAILGHLVVFVSESGHLAAFDLRSGDLAAFQTHARVAFWDAIVADDRLLIVATDGHLWVYEASALPSA